MEKSASPQGITSDSRVLLDRIETEAPHVEDRVIAWRRHFHEHPELSNREFETAKTIATEMGALGLELRTGVAHTGVVATLEGALPGPVVALRADMDALPVREETALPFASTRQAEYLGQTVGVMHACGHDAHTAILMGAATLLSRVRDQLPGTIKFLFQPAEEGTPPGEEGGANLMVREGVLDDPKVSAIFGLHVDSQLDVQKIEYASGPALASSDDFSIHVRGRQTHGSSPWDGADPVVAAAHIVTALQTVVSRKTDLTRSAAVVSVGTIQGGVRTNIIPQDVHLTGTIRTLDEGVRDKVRGEVQRVARSIGEGLGTEVEVQIRPGYPVTYNEPELAAWSVQRLSALAGEANVSLSSPIMGAEDFSYYQQKVPGFFFFVGAKPAATPVERAAPHHSPHFYLDESGFLLGVRALSRLAVDYLFRLS